MSQDSRFDRYEIFVASAVVAAHASADREGFRHKDVKFLIELFSNWLEVSLPDSVLEVQNTQVARYMHELGEEGFSRRLSRKGYPRYLLTRIGLIELLSRIINRTYFHAPEQFFFLVYFVKNYRERLTEMVRSEGRQFPIALKIEIEELLNVKALVQREVDAVEKEIRKLDERMRDAKSTSSLVTKLLKAGEPFGEVVAEAERLYPYDLNTMKPLTQLIAEIPKELRQWELEYGNMCRVRELWEPSKGMLQAYLRELKKLARETA